MSTVVGNAEVAAINDIARLETLSGRPLTDEQKDYFKMGFFAGALHGMDTAMKTVKEKLPT